MLYLRYPLKAFPDLRLRCPHDLHQILHTNKRGWLKTKLSRRCSYKCKQNVPQSETVESVHLNSAFKVETCCKVTNGEVQQGDNTPGLTRRKRFQERSEFLWYFAKSLSRKQSRILKTGVLKVLAEIIWLAIRAVTVGASLIAFLKWLGRFETKKKSVRVTIKSVSNH